MGFRFPSGKLRLRFDRRGRVWVVQTPDKRAYAASHKRELAFEYIRQYWRNHVLVQ